MAIILLWFGGFAIFNYHIHNYNIDKTSKTDAIIALTGGSNRIKEAVELINNRLSNILFISGVKKGISFEEIAHTQNLKINPTCSIIIEQASTNTVENAIQTSEWMKKNNIKTIRLVTSNYHIPRSYLEFKTNNPDLKIIINPVYSNKVSDKWWKNGGSFMLIASEYTKFMFVYLKNLLSLIMNK